MQYFEAKGMTKPQIAIFVEERKWHYRGSSPCFEATTQTVMVFLSAFGFCAALLEDLPIVGVFFSVSNRIVSECVCYPRHSRTWCETCLLPPDIFPD